MRPATGLGLGQRTGAGRLLRGAFSGPPPPIQARPQKAPRGGSEVRLSP